jgi:hypothetical protein
MEQSVTIARDTGKPTDGRTVLGLIQWVTVEAVESEGVLRCTPPRPSGLVEL